MPIPAFQYPFRVVSYAAVAADAAATRALDDIFFASSNTKGFSDAAARTEFRERWLGRYLQHYPDNGFVIVAANGELLGYICGSLNDPAKDPLFADQPHFAQFAHVTPLYPAQLHVNVAEHARGHGLGFHLIEAYAGRAQAAGAPGIHAITTRGARNIGFYTSIGFAEVASVVPSGAAIGSKELVLLGRKLR